MGSKYFLGIDTSAYTSSLAIVDSKNNVIYNLKELLKVKNASLGLRQQEAIFQHMNNLPMLLSKIDYKVIENLCAIGVSSKPRNIKDSYMPVFLQGLNLAKSLAKVLNLDMYEFSHQEGHIASILIDNEELSDIEFASIHISGGTTELLLVDNKKELSIEKIGSTLDISIGQLIDRIGVYLNLDFPAGPSLDNLSRKGKVLDLNIPISIKNNFNVNISGLENYFKKLIDSNKYSKEDIGKTLFFTINKILLELIKNMHNKYHIENLLITGGVSANSYLREDLQEEVDRDIKLYFPKKDLSSDNAVGTAYLAKKAWKEW